jgi:hypothetical protein
MSINILFISPFKALHTLTLFPEAVTKLSISSIYSIATTKFSSAANGL